EADVFQPGDTLQLKNEVEPQPPGIPPGVLCAVGAQNGGGVEDRAGGQGQHGLGAAALGPGAQLQCPAGQTAVFPAEQKAAFGGAQKVGAVLLLAVQRVVRQAAAGVGDGKDGFALAARAQAQHDPPAARGAGPHSVGEQMEADAGEIPAVRLDDQLVQAAAVQTETDIQLLLQLILFGAEGADKGAQLYRLPLGRLGLLGAAQQGGQAVQVPVQPGGSHRNVAERLPDLVGFRAVLVLCQMGQIPLAQSDHVQRALELALEGIYGKIF